MVSETKTEEKREGERLRKTDKEREEKDNCRH